MASPPLLNATTHITLALPPPPPLSKAVMYRGIPLGKASVPGFYQEAHSTRFVEATIAVGRANLMQADAADLIRDASFNDKVELRVWGDVGAKIRVMDFNSPGVQVTPFPYSLL